MAIDTSGMITVAEAARRLNLFQEQVRRNLRDGKLQGQRIGNQWFVDEIDVRRKVEGWTTLIDPKLLQEIREARGEMAERPELPLPDEPRLRGLVMDLSDQEGTPIGASLRLYRTGDPEDWFTHQEGVTLEADRGAHGAELHLSWDQATQIRDELTKLLREAGKE